jgi:predicted transcriptional regulator
MPTQAELEILQILWAEQPCTVRTLHERILAGGKSAGYTTVLKQVQRLVDKGALEREIVDGVHYFRANASENQVKEQLAGKIMHTAFGGSALQMVMHALGNQKPSLAELEELKTWLDQQFSEK